MCGTTIPLTRVRAGQKVRRSEGQKVRRSEGQKVRRSSIATLTASGRTCASVAAPKSAPIIGQEEPCLGMWHGSTKWTLAYYRYGSLFEPRLAPLGVLVGSYALRAADQLLPRGHHDRAQPGRRSIKPVPASPGSGDFPGKSDTASISAASSAPDDRLPGWYYWDGMAWEQKQPTAAGLTEPHEPVGVGPRAFGRKAKTGAEGLPYTWLYLVVGVPYAIFLINGGWAEPFRTGAATAFIAGVTITAVGENIIVQYLDDKFAKATAPMRSSSSELRFDVVSIFIAVLALLGWLLYYAVTQKSVPHPTVDFVQIIAFFLICAYLPYVRFALTEYELSL